MKAIEIINLANIKADDNIDINEVIGFLNAAIATTNEELSTLLPSISRDNIDQEYNVIREAKFIDKTNPTPQETIRANQYKSINELMCTQILVSYTTYLIKVQDGSEYEWNHALKTYHKSVRSFNAQFRDYLKDELKTEFLLGDNMQTRGLRGGVVPMGQDSPTGPSQTWGTSPGIGTGNVSGNRANSNDPFGRNK